jgi:hypothetical protein
VGDADVAWLAGAPVRLRPEVLEELEPVVAAGKGEVRHAHVRVLVSDDVGEVAAFLLLRDEHVHAEEVSVEGERAVEVAHGEARVVEGGQKVTVSPPSTVSTWPVTYVFSAEQSQAACAAISAGSAGRRKGSLRFST